MPETLKSIDRNSRLHRLKKLYARKTVHCAIGVFLGLIDPEGEGGGEVSDVVDQSV